MTPAAGRRREEHQMPKFIFAYHQPKGYVPGTDASVLAKWEAFLGGIADNVVDPGLPVFERTSLGEVGDSTQLGGYSIVDAADLEAAVGLAKGCPSLTYGGGVQVGVLSEVPGDHIVNRLGQRAAG
jgi:hypothetical protein